MTRTFYDAVNIDAAIPDNPDGICGYIDGHYQSFAGLAARFPNAVHVPIAVWPSTNDGLVLDVETGDASPAQAPGWCEMRRAAGVIPSVYCGQSEWPTVRAAFQSAGVEEPPYWIASYPGPGEGVMIDGAIAHQWGGDTQGGYDVSVVADYWPGVDTEPTPTPPKPIPPVLEEEPFMATISINPKNGRETMIWSGFGGQLYTKERSKNGGSWGASTPVPDAIESDPVPYDKRPQ